MASNLNDHGPSRIRNVKDLGIAVRRRREAAGYAIAEAAAWCNVGTRFLFDLENGKASTQFGLALDIAQRLGLEIWQGRAPQEAAGAISGAIEPVTLGIDVSGAYDIAWAAHRYVGWYVAQRCGVPVIDGTFERKKVWILRDMPLKAYSGNIPFGEYSAGNVPLPLNKKSGIVRAGFQWSVASHVHPPKQPPITPTPNPPLQNQHPSIPGMDGSLDWRRLANPVDLDRVMRHLGWLWDCPVEAENGPGYDLLFDAVDEHCSMPIVNVEALVRWAVLSVMLGDSGTHLGRIRIREDERGRHIAPIPMITPMPELSGERLGRGLRIGKEWPNDFLRADQWVLFAKVARVHPKTVFKIMKEFSARVPKLVSEAYTDFLGHQPVRGVAMDLIKQTQSRALRMSELGLAASFQGVAGLKKVNAPSTPVNPTEEVQETSQRIRTVVEDWDEEIYRQERAALYEDDEIYEKD